MNLLRAFRPIASDFLSTIALIVALQLFADVRIAILVGIATGIGQFAYLRLRGEAIAPIQWMSLFLVIVLGGTALYTADPRFVMVKPTIGQWAIGLVMLQRGWMLRYMPAPVREELPAGAVIAFGYVWALLLFALGGANLYIALNYGRTVWSWYAGISPAFLIGLFLIQYLTMRQLVIRSRRASA